MAEKDLNQVGYILGILSVIFGVLFSFAGLIIGIVGLFYTKHKSEISKKAKILNIIGIIVSLIFLALTIYLSYKNGSISSLITTP